MKLSRIQLVLLWMLLFTGSTAFAQGPQVTQRNFPSFAVLGTLGFLPVSVPQFSYGGWLAPHAAPGEIDQERLILQVPIYHEGGDNFSLNAGANSLHFGGAQTLDSSGILVPVSLYKVDLGGAYSHDLGEGKLWGARLSVGSASDKPFDGIGVTTFGASAYYSWESSEQSRWILTVFASNNNPILDYIPIPGFIYLYQTKTFIGLFGIPLTSMVWMPSDGWMFTLSAFGPTINAEIAYGDRQGVSVFTGFNWSQQIFLREARPDPNDRLYFDEKHIPFGVRFPLFKAIKTDLVVGYAFDGSVYEGTKFGTKENGQSPLGHSIYGAWNFKIVL